MNKRKEEKDRSVKLVNDRIHMVNLMKGVNRTKEQQEEIRINAYCRKTNSIKTHGRKRYTHSYPTTSQMEWEKITLERKGIETDEIKWMKSLNEMHEETPRPVNKKERTIIIWDGEKIDLFRGKTAKKECDSEEIILWKPDGSKRITIQVEPVNLRDLPKEMDFRGKTVDTEDLIRAMMRYETQIYKI